MTQLAQPSEYYKECIPGYAGHVPSKNERFGGTAGQIMRETLHDRGIHPIKIKKKVDERARMYSSVYVPRIDKNKKIFGNNSREGENWPCGPNHMIRKQHVPGYTGHIKGLVSENLYSKSYGQSSAQAIHKQHPIGHEVIPKERFQSQNSQTYRAKNFRRFIENPQMQPRKDYDDYTRFINDTFSGERQNMLVKTASSVERRGHRKNSPEAQDQINTLRVYSDRKELYLNRRLNGGKKNLSMSINAGNAKNNTASQYLPDFEVQPKLLESKISKQNDFFDMSDGFKKIFTKDKKDQKMVIPITGYGGHRRGDRSQNFFGKSFRETSLQSRKLQREFLLPKQPLNIL